MNYRILTLDGGGAWALIEVRTLIALYGKDTKGHAVLSDFDMVAANSGGSLVLGGLVEDLTLGELLGYFEDEKKRRSIFSPTTSLGDWALQRLTGLGPKYSAEGKLPALQKLLSKRGNLALPDAIAGVRRAGLPVDVHLLIVGFDYDRNRATFFRSRVAGGPQLGKGDVAGVTLAEAIHASTNAPVNYFDGPAQFHDRPERYWDGGLTGCNNPVLTAVTEAMVLGQAPTDIVALSLGTGTVVMPLAKPGSQPSPYETARGESSLVADLRKLATSILDDPPDVSTFISHVMTGSGKNLPPPAQSRIVRMNPMISPTWDAAQKKWTAPGQMTVAQFKYLANLDVDAVEQQQVEAIADFADLWLAGKMANQAIRMDRDTLKPELGYGTFPEAVAGWNKVKG